MQKRTPRAIAAALAASFTLLTGCSGRDPATASYSIAPEAAPSSRQIKSDASLVTEVDEVPVAVRRAYEIIESYGGYVANSTTDSETRARIVARIPAERFEPAVNGLARLGTEVSRSLNNADVTENLGDLQAELDNQIALRARLRTLLERAANVKEALSIEQQLARVQTRIDSLTKRLALLRTQVSLAALDFSLHKKEPKRERILGPLGALIYGSGWLVRKLFIISG